MQMRASDFYSKDVISIRDGVRLGTVGDIEFSVESGYIENIIICGKSKLFGLVPGEDDIIIPWNQIEVFGVDTILINCEPHRQRQRQRPLLKSFFE